MSTDIKRNLIKIGLFVAILIAVFFSVNSLLSIKDDVKAQSLYCDAGYNLQTVDLVTKCCKDTTFLNHDVTAATFLCKDYQGISKPEYTRDAKTVSTNDCSNGLILAGDSLMDGVRTYGAFNAASYPVNFSAVGGDPAYPIMSRLSSMNYAGQVVVIHVGTNGWSEGTCFNKRDGVGDQKQKVIEMINEVIKSAYKVVLIIPRDSSLTYNEVKKESNTTGYYNGCGYVGIGPGSDSWIQNVRQELQSKFQSGGKLIVKTADELWGDKINYIDGIHTDNAGYKYMANEIAKLACNEAFDPNMAPPGNGNSSGGGTDPTNPGGTKVVNPTAYTNLKPGTPVNACKLGANSAVELPRLIDYNNYFKQTAGDLMQQRNYNFGWVSASVNSISEMKSNLLFDVAADLTKSGARLIFRPCDTNNGCDIFGTLTGGASEKDIDFNARRYATKLAKVAIALKMLSDSRRYDVSIWALAGPNEPDRSGLDHSAVTKFMNDVSYYLSQSGTFVCAGASTDEQINSGTYVCPGELAGDSGRELYYKYRGHINLLSPTMTLANTSYLDQMYADGARFEDLTGITMNIYPFGVYDNSLIDSLQKAIDYAKKKNKKLYFMEVGVAPGVNANDGYPFALTDEWNTRLKYDMVLQALNSPYIEAMLLYNGLPMSGKPTSNNVNDEINNKTLNGPITRGDFLGKMETDVPSTLPKYDKDQYYANRRLENTTGSEYPRVIGAYTAFGTIPDLSDNNYWKACRYSIALAQGDILDKNGYPIDKNKYYAIRLTYPTLGFDCTQGDIAEPTTRMNPDWMYFYESQIYDMLDAAGCSNRYTFSCQNNLAQTSLTDGSTVAMTTSTGPDVQRMSYGDLTQKAVAVEKTTDGANKAYFDLPDKKLIIGNSENFAKTCINYNLLGCKFEGQQIAAGLFCVCNSWEEYQWQNIPTDVIYYGSVYTSVRMDIPTSRALSSTRADGTDDLNYNQYGQIMRSSYTGNLTEDLSRKVSTNIQLLTPMGRQVSIAHSIGTATQLYGYDPTDYNINYDPTTGKSYVPDPNVISKSFDPFNYFREIPTGASASQLMSPTASRTDILTTNQGTKLLKYYADKFFTQSKDTTANILKINTTIQMNQDLKNQISKNINVKNYTLDDINGKTQVNASEIQSDEYIVDMRSIDIEDGVSCAKLFNNYKPSDKNGGDIPEIGNVLPMKYYVVDNELQKYDYSSKCGNKADYPQAKLVRKVNGKVVETIKGKEGQYSLLNPICYVSYCRTDPPRILDNQTKFADYTVIPYLQSIPPARFITYQDINGVKTKVAFAKSDYEPLTGHFLKQVAFDTPTIQSASGMLQVIRTAWQANQRFEFENYNTNPAIRQDLVGNVSQRICINQNYSVQATLFTRAYSTSQLQGYNLGTVGAAACLNPNNGGMYGYKRPMVQANKQYATSTAEFPWLGTVTALNERMSLLKFNPNTAGNTPLSQCGPGNNDLVCLCNDIAYASTKRDLNDPNARYRWDPMAIYLCQNSMLTYNEMVSADLLDLNVPVIERTTRAKEYNPFGCNISGSSTIPVAPPASSSPLTASCTEALANPDFINMVKKTAETTCVPPEVIAAIWSNESNCQAPKAVSNINDGIILPSNNTICSVCTAEILPGYSGENKSTNEVNQDQLSCVSTANQSKSITDPNNSGYGGACSSYGFNVQCCDVRGAFQTELKSWNSIQNRSDFKSCLSSLGISRNVPDRAYFGDSMCAGGSELRVKADTYNKNVGCTNWQDIDISEVARRYYGNCSSTNYCSDAVNKAKQFAPYFK